MFIRRDKESSRGPLSAWLGLVLAFMLFALAAPAARADIVSRGAAATASYPSESTQTFTVAAPAGVRAGDMLVASLGFGNSQAKSQPSRLTQHRCHDIPGRARNTRSCRVGSDGPRAWTKPGRAPIQGLFNK